jgi:hypothetical protein
MEETLALHIVFPPGAAASPAGHRRSSQITHASWLPLSGSMAGRDIRHNFFLLKPLLIWQLRPLG